MLQRYDMHGRDAASAKEARPVEVQVLVEQAIVDVVRQDVFNLDGRAKSECHSRIVSTRHGLRVMDRECLELEGCLAFIERRANERM